MPYGLLAGNGRFPILALETARELGETVIAIGIKEEAPPEIEALAAKTYWISLGALGKLIDICKSEGITELMMAGQVKHASIFSSIAPDWRLAKLLFSLKEKNTEALIGGVAQVLAAEGIRLVDSTLLLKPLLAEEGVLAQDRAAQARMLVEADGGIDGARCQHIDPAHRHALGRVDIGLDGERYEIDVEQLGQLGSGRHSVAAEQSVPRAQSASE